jgi:AcrR family transcriptional regulator
MRQHGWGGHLPENDEEATARILAAAQALLAENPAVAPSISDVAARVSVTRQTIYRYFPSVGDLLMASVHDGIEDFLDATARHLAGFDTPAEAVVECIAYAFEEMGRRADIVLVLAASTTSPAEFLSPMARGLARSMLARFPFDWDAHGFGEADLDGLAEMMLRTLMSFAYAPGEPARTPAALRRYLRRWVGPAVLPNG